MQIANYVRYRKSKVPAPLPLGTGSNNVEQGGDQGSAPGIAVGSAVGSATGIAQGSVQGAAPGSEQGSASTGNENGNDTNTKGNIGDQNAVQPGVIGVQPVVQSEVNNSILEELNNGLKVEPSVMEDV
jgi:hypothetical protein